MLSYTLITGATGGLGKAFAVACASRGQKLILTDISENKLDQLAETLGNTYGVDVKTYACNLMEQQDRLSLFKYIAALNAELYMTINVAGLDFEGGVETLNSDKLVRVLRVNTEATLDITRYAASINHCNHFYIINVASMAGFYAMPLKALYAASKRAIIQFSLAVREEIREKGGHILALCPAGLRTNSKVTAKIEAQGFMGRLTTVDIGKVVDQTLKRALMDRPKYVPGFINMLIVGFSALISDTVKAKLVFNRWKGANNQLSKNVISKKKKLMYD